MNTEEYPEYDVDEMVEYEEDATEIDLDEYEMENVE